MFGDRLRFLRTQKNMTQRDLAKLLGIATSTIGMYEQGRRDPDTQTINFLADYFLVTTDFLLDRVDETTIDLSKIKTMQNGGPTPPTHPIPVLGKIRAGTPILAEDQWEDTIEISNHIIADFALRVIGDSMQYAGIFPNDLVLCCKTNYANHGQIVAAGVEEVDWSANLKYYILKDGKALLRSANPDYEDIEFTPNHRIIGVMTALLREDSPPIRTYQQFLYHKEYRDEKWLEVIENAVTNGIRPEFVNQIIENQVNLAKRLAEKKE